MHAVTWLCIYYASYNEQVMPLGRRADTESRMLFHLGQHKWNFSLILKQRHWIKKYGRPLLIICLSACLPVCLLICLLVCLSVCLSAWVIENKLCCVNRIGSASSVSVWAQLMTPPKRLTERQYHSAYLWTLRYKTLIQLVIKCDRSAAMKTPHKTAFHGRYRML